LYDQLYQHGYISSRLFSIWLNTESASTGSILFGGVDHSKYYGSLQYTPVVTSGPAPGVFTGWAVNVMSLLLHNGKHSTNLLPNNTTLTSILDSGSPNMYLPSSVVDTVATDMNSTMHAGFRYVDCALHRSIKALEFRFGASGHGPRIRVPYREIIYPYSDPANIGPVNGKDGRQLCYLSLIETTGPIYLLGDTFIRSTYLVYDVDHLQVGMAPVR
jgi:Eukaryotic aspartyl protease